MPKNIPSTDKDSLQQVRQPAGDLKKPVQTSEGSLGNIRQQSVILRKECQEVFIGARNHRRPDPAMVKILLAEAERNVKVCDEVVVLQRAIITELESNGHDGRAARSGLHALLNTQALNILTRDRLLAILSG